MHGEAAPLCWYPSPLPGYVIRTKPGSGMTCFTFLRLVRATTHVNVCYWFQTTEQSLRVGAFSSTKALIFIFTCGLFNDAAHN
ncbi:hypothetical protein B7P43_G16813 [Cryptotermes secundus]|uniref:Uncharacterized protein n=1 Tax=Cryptotermes secundus TaxID=105785 RepID=A0A2J7QUN0_9NEOP|nr:hypothetical protein B7P43_G16813 [Cryptotermes secundus]